MKSRILIVILLIAHITFAQKALVNEYSTIDKEALQLPDSLIKTTDNIARYITSHFETERDKTRAIFIWVATNIQYDVENMFAINFYEKEDEKIRKALKTRKGICENYALLFNDICLKSAIKSFVIYGYTQQDGFADYIPHAWCAALVDGSWFLFDPTWGSGYINGTKFIKKINNDYYKRNPLKFIESHMPFDYLWQFLNYPITNQEFYEGKAQQNKSKIYFNFTDSIQVYENQSHIEQLISAAGRIEKNGVRNSLIFDRLHHLRLEIENDRQTKTINLYNSAVVEYNDAIKYFNEFINYRNNQFKPERTDTDIQSMIDAAENKLKEAKIKLGLINTSDLNLTNLTTQLTREVDTVSTKVIEQQNWLNVYFSKGKSGRKSMLYDRKITWFGIPLN